MLITCRSKNFRAAEAYSAKGMLLLGQEAGYLFLCSIQVTPPERTFIKKNFLSSKETPDMHHGWNNFKTFKLEMHYFMRNITMRRNLRKDYQISKRKSCLH